MRVERKIGTIEIFPTPQSDKNRLLWPFRTGAVVLSDRAQILREKPVLK